MPTGGGTFEDVPSNAPNLCSRQLEDIFRAILQEFYQNWAIFSHLKIKKDSADSFFLLLTGFGKMLIKHHSKSRHIGW